MNLAELIGSFIGLLGVVLLIGHWLQTRALIRKEQAADQRVLEQLQKQTEEELKRRK